MKTISRFATIFVFVASFAAPLFAVAQFALPTDSPTPNVTPTISGSGGINPTYLQGYKTSIIGIINGMLVPVLIAIAFITFLWGVYRYFILGADSDTERATGRQFVLWGIIGFVVILSVWALVNIVSGTLGLQVGNTAPRPPTI